MKNKKTTQEVSNFYKSYLETSKSKQLVVSTQLPETTNVKSAISDLNLFIQEYPVSFYKLRDIINSIDPLNLFCLGCPNDEYEYEVMEIMQKCLIVKGDVDAIKIAEEIIESEICNLYFEEDQFYIWFKDFMKEII